MAGKSGSKKRGSLAFRLSCWCLLAALVSTGLLLMIVLQTVTPAIPPRDRDVVTMGWLLGGVVAALGSVAIFVVAYKQGASVAERIVELGLAVARIGRAGSDVRVRSRGNDELTALGRGLQYLATDLAAVAREAERGGGLSASQDPLVREMRDKALPQGLPKVEGYELDGALGPGSRGGMEYFDCIAAEAGAVVLVVSHEGLGAVSAAATRLARDELLRALRTGATARKALSHTNRVLHRELPKGACAKACLVELGAEEAKLYQAGFRPPLLVCAAGRVAEHAAEGLALGLDEGAVFEKGLRSTKVPVRPGVRLVLVNESALQLEGLTELVAQHSAKHTTPFLNLVLGALEKSAGEGGLREDVVLVTAKRF